MGKRFDEPTAAEYLALVPAFPLVSVRDGAHLEQALEVIDRLVENATRSPAEEGYLRALTDLLETYESAHVMIPPTSGVEALRFLTEANGLTQADLVPVLGTRWSVSEVLADKRCLAVSHITRLAERFGMPADVFVA